MTPESKLKTSVLRYLKTLPRTWIYKTSDRYSSGIPDILACIDGRFFAFELKATTKASRSEPLQRFNLQRIRFAGGFGGVCYSVEDVKLLVALP